MIPNLLSFLLVLGVGAADWQPVSLGPRTTALVTARLAVTCLGQVPPVAYQLTQSGVAVKVGSRRVRTACTQAAVDAAMRYRGELPPGTDVKVAAYDYLRGVTLSHAAPEGIARLHQLTAEAVAGARE